MTNQILKMKLKLFLVLFSVMCIDSSFAQTNLHEPIIERPKKNVVFISFWTMPEFNAIMGQYERIIFHFPKSFLNSVGIRIGIGSMKEWKDGGGINYSSDIFTIFGKNNHHIEIGAGLIYIPEKTDENFDMSLDQRLPSFSLSYRYQKPLSKILHFNSLDWTPMNTFVFQAGIGFVEIIHLSLGYCF
jgi:hypothetical protein